jgi:hypothetical protein
VSNIISHEAVESSLRQQHSDDLHDGCLMMQNGLTSVLLCTLALAGGRVARTDWQEELMAWLGERDQATVGSGVVGFDLNQMGWTLARFDDEKRFVLSVIDRARSQVDWSDAGYDVDSVLSALRGLRVLVGAFEAPHVTGADRSWWATEPPSAPFERCGVHGVVLNTLASAGADCCIVCNSQ